MPWNMDFDEPITLPNGRKARTLRQAANYIFGLPAEQYKHPKWQTAMHVLIEAAEGRGPMTFARLGMVQAILKDIEPTEGPGERNAPATKWSRRLHFVSEGERPRRLNARKNTLLREKLFR